MSKSTSKAALLKKLDQAAENARNSVSGYSDEKRSQLEQHGRSLIKGAHAQQVCRP